MRLRIRRRWLWLSGVVAGLVVATALLSLSVDEPLRRYNGQPLPAAEAGERRGEEGLKNNKTRAAAIPGTTPKTLHNKARRWRCEAAETAGS